MTTILNKLLEVAEPIVKSYMTDVTKHDIKAINDMQIGEVRLWCVREYGTWLCYLCQDIDENKHFTGLITNLMKRREEYIDVEVMDR